MSARSETTTLPRHTTSTAPDTLPSTNNQTSATGRSRASGDPGDTSYNSRLSKAPSSIEKLRAEQAKRAKAAAAAQASAAESSDSESDYDAGGSSDEDGGSVSSAASSIAPSSPPGSSRFDSFVSGPKRKVQVGHGIPPQKKEVASIWPDEMGEEERLAMLKANLPDTHTELMGMSAAERKSALKNVKMNIDRKIRLQEATTQGTAATTTNKPPLDDDVLRYWGNHYLDRAGTALKSKYGYVTQEKQSLYARKALHDFIPGRYDGSTSTYQWSTPWKEDAKAAKDKVTIVLKTNQDKTMYRDEYWIPKHRHDLKGPNGEEVTTEQIVAHYDKNINPTEATLDRDHELCSRFSVFQNNPLTTTTNGKIFEFDTLTNAQLEMVKEMKAIADEGGTEAETKHKWDQTFGKQAMPEVKITDTAVSFFNPLPGCILTGEMPDGTVVTYSCKDTSMTTTGQASAPTRRELMVDTSGPNPFYISEKELESAKDWDSIKTAYDQLEKERKAREATTKAEEAATKASAAKAAAREKARLRVLPSTNGADSLLTIPKKKAPETTGSETADETTSGDKPSKTNDPITSWNGHKMHKWLRPAEPSEANAGQMFGRLRSYANTRYQLSKKYPELDEQTATNISTALADGLLGGNDKYLQTLSEIPKVLAEQGIQTTETDVKSLINSEDRPTAWDDQILKDWAMKPSSRPGTAEPLSQMEACSRELGRSLLASSLPFPLNQANAISSFMIDSEAAEEAGKMIRRELAKNPKYRPDKSTILELGKTTKGTTAASTATSGTTVASTAAPSTTASTNG